MSSKNTYKSFDSDPWWTTQVRKRYNDVLVGIDNKVWMYRKVASGPVAEAVSASKMLGVGEPIDEAVLEVSKLTGRTRTNRRSIDKSAYRNCHVLTINVPRHFSPPNIENRDYLARLYPDRYLDRRITLFGVELKPVTGGGAGGFSATMESIRHTLLVGGTPMSDYEKDRRLVEAGLTRAGLHMPTPEDLNLANSWWNNGNHADIPYMPHGDHLHMFNSETAARSGHRLVTSDDPDLADCKDWPPIAGHRILSFATVEAFDMDYMRASDPRILWGASLLDSGATAVSIRFSIEPSKITREELRRHKKNYRDDIAERYANGKMERAEQEEMLQRLSDVEAHYSGDGPPTLTDMSITVATVGRSERNDFDPTEMGERAGVSMDSMLNRQEQAFIDTMLCSPIRSNPHLHDMPSTALAYAGLPDLAIAGDRPEGKRTRPDGVIPGAVALLGFSERDKQPMWMDAMAATDEDSVPICLVVGQSGSGKSVLMQWLADQYARTTNDRGERTPVIMVDLKEQALALDTPIPLADGTWTTMRDLEVGQSVIGGNGRPAPVTSKSKVWPGETTPMFRLTLDDGRFLDASHHHRWRVSTFNSRARARHDKSGRTSPWVVLTTEQMVAGVLGGKYQLPLSGASDTPERDLYVDPYLLGMWLGDGFSQRGSICSGYSDLDEALAQIDSHWDGQVRVDDSLPQSAQIHLGRRTGECRHGHLRSDDTKCDTCRSEGYRARGTKATNPTFGEALSHIGVLNNKHIPDDYLNGSHEQRLELLRGLMDTDGTCHNKTGRCSFSSSRRALAEQVLSLVRSLGIKAFMNYVPQSASYTVTFKTDVVVFRMARKAARQLVQQAPGRHSRGGVHRRGVNIVESIEPIAGVDSACIEVDSPDHTYLAGDYVVTHNSDFTTSVELSGGTSFTLSDLINDGANDGVFDAIRFAATPQAGIDRAHSLIMQVNPFGTRAMDFETPLRQALQYGVDHGATCTGQALRIAAEAQVNDEVVDIMGRIEAAATSAIFRAICGFNPNSPGLRVSGGTTYIRIGEMSLDLPSPGSKPDEQTQMQRTWLALVKAMIYGSISALANRQGVVLFDEGWIFLGSGRAEMEAMGRLARSQQVFPIIFTQRTQDALRAELEGYISRGIILPIEDPKEASAALRLFNLEQTPQRMARITGKATRGDAGAERGAPNWNSFRALRDPKTKKVVRGTIGLYVDLAGNAVPTEIALSPTFLLEASTNREDMAKRAAEKALADAAEAEARSGM